jgi:AraC family transcriptional regulator
MDDHGIRGGDLAAEVFFSRSLLDRLVKAAAGEPAARLRRRLLLERAAYRLRAGDTSVIDISVEAGYSSGEAFARAFRRAFGSAPTAWRSSAGGLHSYPPGGLRVPARKEAICMTFVAGVIDHHLAALGQLLDRAAILPASQLDAPLDIPGPGIDASPTIRSLLSRLVGQMEMWGAAMASRPYDFAIERQEPIASLHERLRRDPLSWFVA